MKLFAENFRPFREIGNIPIKKINLLVGENSSGKTSFLAAYHYASQLFDFSSPTHFNKEPFFLGAYDQIAHTRGGRAGKSDFFRLGQTRRIRLRKEAQKILGTDETRFSEVTFWFRFINHRAQPSLSEIFLNINRHSVLFEVVDDEMLLAYSFRGQKILDFKQNVDSSLQDRPTSIFDFYRVLTSAQVSCEKEEEKEALNAFSLLLLDSMRSTRIHISSSSPVRSKPERTYDPRQVPPNPGGAHVPYELAQLYHSDRSAWDALKGRLDDFGRASGLFDDISVKTFGSESDPFQLYFKIRGPKSNLADVGYGVSQILPVLYDILKPDAEGKTFLLQQPEVHLHPRAQAELGSLICTISSQLNATFIIETHSDFLIDRIVSESETTSLDAQLLYFHKDRLETSIDTLPVKNGHVEIGESSYRDFFKQELKRNLGL